MPVSRFETLSSIEEVADRLFATGTDVLRNHLLGKEPEASEPAWAAAVRQGRFAIIPRDLDWSTSRPLAMLIDGYGLAEALDLGDPFDFQSRQYDAAAEAGSWAGDAAVLWTTLYLEHRRWYFSSPHEPDEAAVRLLDRLVRQLREALTGEIIQ